MTSRIDCFEGDYYFLSNFYPEPMRYEGHIYGSAEHAYQAEKTVVPEERDAIRRAATADDAKELGKTLTVRDDWQEVKIPAMAAVLYAKFSGHEGLRGQLLATGDAELVEGNWWGDRFWGVHEGSGANHLGKLLMQLRDQLREDEGRDDEGRGVQGPE